MTEQVTMKFGSEETKSGLSYEEALDLFVRYVNEMRKHYYEKCGYSFPADKVVLDGHGVKYQRLATVSPSGNGRSAYCFVEKATGNVLKCDGWKRPAKHPRGNIYEGAKDPKNYGVGEYGANYLS